MNCKTCPKRETCEALCAAVRNALPPMGAGVLADARGHKVRVLSLAHMEADHVAATRLVPRNFIEEGLSVPKESLPALSLRHRVILRLYEHGELRTTEIAEMFDLAPVSVRCIVHRVRKKWCAQTATLAK